MRPRRTCPTLLAVALSALFLVLIGGSGPAAAHEPLTVGPYGFLVGWRAEPPVVGAQNGLDLRINYTSNGTAVDGAEGSLTAILSFGSYSVAKAIEPNDVKGAGWYTFDVVPTRNGTYKVQFAGSIRGYTVANVIVTLDDVAPSSTIEFPVPDPTASDLLARNAALQAQVGTAVLVGAIGIVAGLAGIGVAVIAIRRGKPRP